MSEQSGIDEAVLERLIEREPNSGCWLWSGPLDSSGYGRFGRRTRAHRLMWERANGRKIPAGLFACHHCDTPACVNPAHIYVGTPRDNVADAVRRRRQSNARKDFCRRGHPLSGDNLRIRIANGRPQRICLTCRRENHAVSNQRRSPGAANAARAERTRLARLARAALKPEK